MRYEPDFSKQELDKKVGAALVNTLIYLVVGGLTGWLMCVIPGWLFPYETVGWSITLCVTTCVIWPVLFYIACYGIWRFTGLCKGAAGFLSDMLS